jgi:hypothetical protein
MPMLDKNGHKSLAGQVDFSPDILPSHTGLLQDNFSCKSLCKDVSTVDIHRFMEIFYLPKTENFFERTFMFHLPKSFRDKVMCVSIENETTVNVTILCSG